MRELILGIESSCDETAACILEDGEKILSNVVATQIDTHASFGGVMPEIASRLHVNNILPVLKECFLKAGIEPSELSAVAATTKPGLIGALHVGALAGKTIAEYLDIPFISCHHLAGHIYASEFASKFQFPLLAIIVSGGNSELVYMEDHLKFKLIGETLDDAIGEGLDKIARELGLPYPGGVQIDRLTKDQDITPIRLPKVRTNGYSLSYSGLKSHTIRLIRESKSKGELDENKIKQFAFSIEKAFVDQLLDKAFKAATDLDVNQIVLGGGVSANSYLRKEIIRRNNNRFTVTIPPLWCTTDNAAMIAKLGHHLYQKKCFSSLDCKIEASSSLESFSIKD